MKNNPIQQKFRKGKTLPNFSKVITFDRAIALFSLIFSVIAVLFVRDANKISYQQASSGLTTLDLKPSGLVVYPDRTICFSRIRIANLGGAADSIIGMQFDTIFDDEKGQSEDSGYAVAEIKMPFLSSKAITLTQVILSLADSEIDKTDDMNTEFLQPIDLPVQVGNNSVIELRINLLFEYDFANNPYQLKVAESEKDVTGQSKPILFQVKFNTATGKAFTAPVRPCWQKL